MIEAKMVIIFVQYHVIHNFMWPPHVTFVFTLRHNEFE